MTAPFCGYPQQIRLDNGPELISENAPMSGCPSSETSFYPTQKTGSNGSRLRETKGRILAEAEAQSDELRVWEDETPDLEWTPIEELVLKLSVAAGPLDFATMLVR